MDELIDFLLGIADDAHRAHLATDSYAEHVALGEFYDKVRTDADALFEGLIAIGSRPEAPPEFSDAASALKDAYGRFQTMRGVCDNDPALENLFDTVGGHFMSAIYKLSNLK